MKKSELLKIVLANYHKSGRIFLCDRICDEALKSKHPRALAAFREVTYWIHAHIEGYFSVYEWLTSKGFVIEKYGDEMKEYRRLWLINMIEYWERKGD